VNIKLPSLNWHYGWNVIAMTLLFQSLCIGMHYYCFTLWVVPWSTEFNTARSHIMLAIVASQIISGLISPLAGRALDRLPAHILICGGALIFSLGLLLIACSQSMWQIIAVFLFVLPIGLVLTGVMAAQTLATRWFTKDRGLAIACATLGTSIGGFMMPPIAAALMAAFGWRITFVVFAAAATFLITPIAWRVLRREPPLGDETGARTIEQTASTLPPPIALRASDLLHDNNFRKIVLAFMPLVLAFSAVQMNLGAYAQDIGLTQQDAALMIAQLSVLMLIGKIFSGKLVDHYDHRILYWILAGGLGVSIAIIIIASSVSAHRGLLLFGTALLGFVYAGYLPLNATIIAKKFGTRAFGQVTGMANTFLGFGTAGSFLAASLRDISGSYVFAFTAFLLLLIIGAWQMRKL
jgi:MFS family permease